MKSTDGRDRCIASRCTQWPTSAVGFGIPSGGWYDFIKDDGPLALGATDGIDRLVVFGGGFPITVDGQIVGAVGVSGGHYSQDEAVAQAGLAALDG